MAPVPTKRSVPFVVNAAALAGGLGTRLRPAVSDRPKALAEVAGRPCLAWLLERLTKEGVEHTVLCTGYMGEQIERAFGRSFAGMRLSYSLERQPLGTGGALRNAADLLSGEAVLVLNSDSFCDAQISSFVAWHRERAARASILLTRVPNAGRFGRVETDAQGRVTRFLEKDPAAGAGWINAGVYLLSRDLILTIPTGRAVSLEREMFPAWTGRGLYGWRAGGRFLDIGTPESYAEAAAFFAETER